MPKPVKAPLPRFGGLLVPSGPAALAGAVTLPLAAVDPNPAQPRQVFDATALDELAASIRQHGVIEPILVRPVGARYQIVAGERRVRAARLAGLETIPALVRELSDADAAVLTALENLQREDLDLEDEARQYQQLIVLTGLSQRALAARLGVGYKVVQRRLRLLVYPDLLISIRDGIMTQREALDTAAYRASLPRPARVWPMPWDEDADDADAAAVGHGVPVLPDPEPAPTERAVLDAPPDTGYNPEPPASARPRQAAPWRARPVVQFRAWLQVTPAAVVPAAERATVRAEMEAIIEQARAFLAELPPDQE
jgi:ParB/RepB/Spo0J family partition protein